MSRKSLIAIFCGVIAAGLVFLIAGLVLFLAMKDRVAYYLVGLFAIFFGTFMAGITFIALAVVLIIWAVKKSKDKKEKN